MKKHILTILLSFLALHLLYSNVSLLVDLHKVIYDIAKLDLWQKASKILFAFSYSIMTVIIITIYPKRWIILASGLLDGFAVYLKYNIDQTNFLLIASLYFGIYTAFIVIVAGLISNKKNEKKQNKIPFFNNLENRIIPKILNPDYEQKQNELKQKKRSLINSINASKDPSLKLQKQNELKQIENEILNNI